MVPSAGDPPTTPFTDHVTAVFPVPVTVDANAFVPPSGTVAVVGETTTVTDGITVTDACANEAGFATDVARIVTAGGDGTIAGAM
jgi:hypothetical protein